MAQPPTELKAVLSHYDLGTLREAEKDQRGTVNTSYVVELVKDGRTTRYFLRRYKAEIRPEEIVFEHALIDHLAERGHCPVARVQRTRTGTSYLELDGAGRVFYALFDYLPGEDRYTWVDPRCRPPELRAAGALLAQFHSDVATLHVPCRRAEPKITVLIPEIERSWSACLARSTGNAFDRMAGTNDGLVRDALGGAAEVLQAEAIGLPEVVIHSDYHPGNLRFLGSEITGLVDFDWAKVDLRLFDVALAVWYFCASWRAGADGRLRLAAAKDFLTAYQAKLIQGADIQPLSRRELVLLPELLAASNLYVLYWGLRDYLAKPVDPQEYVVYLKHNIGFARWFNDPGHRLALQAALAALPQ